MTDPLPNRVPTPAAPQNQITGPISPPQAVATAPAPTPAPAPAPMEMPPRRTPSIFDNTRIDKIAGAISEVMAEIGTIQKGGYNSFHDYHYARIEDLLGKLTPLMGKAGLMIIQHEIEQKIAEGNRLAVTYEFTIAHKSGQVWPEKPRSTGLSMLRDRKGNIDDKCLNKCHTSARKYFLLSLFQAPASDIDDGDKDEGATQTHVITGPSPTPEATSAAPSFEPHKIVLPGQGVDAWIEAYIRAIGAAKTEAEVREWDKINGNILQMIADKYKDKYGRLYMIATKRIDDLAGARERREEAATQTNTYAGPIIPGPSSAPIIGASEMPDPQEDITACINWAAQQLMSLNTLDGLNLFWNQTIAPREQEFFPPDWILLVHEYERHHARLSPDEPKAETDEGDLR